LAISSASISAATRSSRSIGFLRKEAREIKPLTVREILDEEIAAK
jgi:hypothetical protein